MTDMRKLEKVIRDVLKERFGNVKFDTIDIKRDYDADGDEILRILVVVEDAVKRLDASRASTVQRYMRPKLADIQETAFPVISYVSRSDYRKQKAAAA